MIDVDVACFPARAVFSVGPLLPLTTPLSPPLLLKFHGHCQLLAFVPMTHLLTVVATGSNVGCCPARAAFFDGPSLPPTIHLPPFYGTGEHPHCMIGKDTSFVVKFSRKKLKAFWLVQKKNSRTPNGTLNFIFFTDEALLSRIAWKLSITLATLTWTSTKEYQNFGFLFTIYFDFTVY